jgi:hypothetical protein
MRERMQVLDKRAPARNLGLQRPKGQAKGEKPPRRRERPVRSALTDQKTEPGATVAVGAHPSRLQGSRRNGRPTGFGLLTASGPTASRLAGGFHDFSILRLLPSCSGGRRSTTLPALSGERKKIPGLRSGDLLWESRNEGYATFVPSRRASPRRSPCGRSRRPRPKR